ncbi:MAG: hypothetical protein GY905_00630, partial [Gammaproteobacteria bacterium]|nr:hypothetical protein [Gammaproteobacteria bacterium]
MQAWGWSWTNIDWNAVDAANAHDLSWEEKEAQYGITVTEGGYRGTLKNDTLGGPNPAKVQKDELWGKGGDDLIIAGGGMDRFKGGAGDDVAWGGTHTGGQQWEFSGDTAFYTGSASRYEVIRNVYVHAETENGTVTKDADGLVMLYRAYDAEDAFSVSAKGVSANTSAVLSGDTASNLATSDLIAANGFYAATIVVDSLGAASGGEGVDTLIGVERLVFGHASSGDHGWLPTNPEHESDASYTINTLAVTSQAEDYTHHYWDHQLQQMVEEQSYQATYTGTGYDDNIAFSDGSPFTSGVGTTFYASASEGSPSASEFRFIGGAGDDVLTGSSEEGVQNRAVYTSAASEYTINITRANDGSIDYVTVTHNIPEDLGGTGVDTLYDIQSAIFSYHSQSGEDHVYFSPRIWADDWDGDGTYDMVNIDGSAYDDYVSPVGTDGSTATDWANNLNGVGNFYRPGGGVDVFDGGTPGDHDDWVQLSGAGSRYHFLWDSTQQDIVIIDRVADSLGGDGHLTIQNSTTGGLGAHVDRIQFGGPFTLNVAFNADGTLRTQADAASQVAVLGDNPNRFTGLYDKRDLDNGTDHGPTLLGALDALATDTNDDGDATTWDVTGLSLTTDYNEDGSADYGADSAPVYFADTSGKGMFTMSADPDLHALDYTVAQILGDTISFDAATAVEANWIASDWGGSWQSYDDPTNPMVQRMISRESADSGTFNQQTGQWEYTPGAYRYELSGMGKNDTLKGGDGNDRFYSDPGDDFYDGRADKKGDWWDAWNNGDVVEYGGYQARYTISGPLTDDDAGTVTGITGGQAYFTVTDSLAMEYGGDGTDTLVNIERIQFGDQDYFL